MPTRIGTIQTTVEVVPEMAIGPELNSQGEEILDRRAQTRAMLERERVIRLRTAAEGFDD